MSAHVCGCDPEEHDHRCEGYPNCAFGRAELHTEAAQPKTPLVLSAAQHSHMEVISLGAFMKAADQPAAKTLIEAWRLTHGDRKTSYGQVEQAFARYAKIWSGLLAAKLREDLTASDVALLMAGLKLAREMNKQASDNVTDAHGYLILHDEIKASNG